MFTEHHLPAAMEKELIKQFRQLASSQRDPHIRYFIVKWYKFNCTCDFLVFGLQLSLTDKFNLFLLTVLFERKANSH